MTSTSLSLNSFRQVPNASILVAMTLNMLPCLRLMKQIMKNLILATTIQISA